MTDERIVVDVEEEQKVSRRENQTPWWIWPLIAMVAILIITFSWNPFQRAEQTVQPEVLAEAIAIAIASNEEGTICTTGTTSTSAEAEKGVGQGQGQKQPLTFRDGCDANGLFFQPGQIVKGPAMVKFNDSTHDAIVVWDQEEYEVKTANEVVWIFLPAPTEVVRTTFPNHAKIYDIRGKQLQ